MKKLYLKKISFMLCILFISMITVHNAQASGGFVDIPKQDEAYEEINYLWNLGVINGYPEKGKTYFKPNNNVTRAQAAKMVVIASGNKPLVVNKSSFSDIKAGTEFSGYVERAVQLGFFKTNIKGQFLPNKPLTRDEMSYVLTKAFKLDTSEHENSDSPFVDVGIKHPYVIYVNTIYSNGITKGSNQKYNPNEQVTRKQFALFVARAKNDKYRLDVPVKSVAAPDVSKVIGRVTVDNLNIRKEANSTSTIVSKLKKGEYVQVSNINGYWAQVTYQGQNGYVHKSYLKLLNQSGNPLKGRIIIIDPGHSGKDPGNTVGSLFEKDVVFKVSKLVEQKLAAAGANVLMTRTEDVYPTLQDRVDFTNASYGEIFVSIHANSVKNNTTANGTETFYAITTGDLHKESIDLATFVNNQIVSDLHMRNRGVKNKQFYVIRNTIIPAILVELGFLTNSEDRAKLSDDQFIALFAESIYKGILEYYSKK